MSIFSLSRPAVEVLPSETLDRLWAEAERLGRIEVDHSLSNRDDYRVRIRFERSSGTVVWVQGADKNIAFAISAAINEARELGASEMPVAQ